MVPIGRPQLTGLTEGGGKSVPKPSREPRGQRFGEPGMWLEWGARFSPSQRGEVEGWRDGVGAA
jgi:hypothetical protein